MKRTWIVLLSVALLTMHAAEHTELDFLEAFAWGDRSRALELLVPDTEQYSYFACLHYQLEGDIVAFDREMSRWRARNGNRSNDNMQELERRRHFMAFTQKPELTWAFLRHDSGLRFSHRPRHEQQSRTYPSRVRPEQVSEAEFLRQASRTHFVREFTDQGLYIAMRENLNDSERRELLGRLTRPDLPGLVPMIVQDLKAKHSRGFGHHAIHRMLTRAQLEELGKRMPSLFKNAAYVQECLNRIEPPPGWRSEDHASSVTYYQELWAFVDGLGSMHNSLKASTLYRLLDHQRHLGHYDEKLFQIYLSLPRPVPYLPPNVRERYQRQRVDWVNFSYRPSGTFPLPPILNEELLVRDFLIRLLADQNSPASYASFFEEKWLGRVFAESKILAGVGEPSDWASYLPPAAYRKILDRVEVNFTLDNPTHHAPGDAVSLDVELKHVDRLLVKIFEIDPFNYYRVHEAPVDQAVDLDGMVPTHESQQTFELPQTRRIRHTLKLPEVSERGVYVVELIGNGVSSRALLQVGHLEVITQPTQHGLVAMILNETGETVKDGKIWLGGQEYAANEKGLILIPFSENPGTRFVILRDGTFASADQINHPEEAYRFSAGIKLDRQSLNRRSATTLILRPDLRLHGFPVSTSLLKDVTVLVRSTDAKGTQSDQEYEATFTRATEWTQQLYVPEGLRRLDVTVTGTMTRISDGEEIELRDQHSISVNQARNGDTLKQMYLMPTAEGWILEARGLNGEPISGAPLDLDFYHPAFSDAIRRDVTTDGQGRVYLGPLPGLSRVKVQGHELNLDLPLTPGRAVVPSRFHLLEGDRMSMPYPLPVRQGDRPVTLLKVSKENKVLSEHNDLVRIADGELTVEGLDAGTYSLQMHALARVTRLVVIQGENRSGFLLGNIERAQATDTRLPSLADVTLDQNEVTLQVRNASLSTRVAVRAARYAGSGLFFPEGQRYAAPGSRTVYPPYAQYVSGRQLGDEIRYVLERKYRELFAGTLLERPAFILNPWEIRETNADLENLRSDVAYEGGRQQLNQAAGFIGDVSSDRSAARKAYGRKGMVRKDLGFDFLPQGSRWWVNLRPDKKGNLTIPLKGLEEQTQLEIVVLDRMGTSVTRVPLPDRALKPREVRLEYGLDPAQAFSRQKAISVLTAGEEVIFQDLATTRYTTVQTVGDLFEILQTLHGQVSIADFAFLSDWPSMEEAEKLSKYHEFASHELHMFLHERDPEFFAEVIRPYLKNKLNKTFVDRWLLEELTDDDVRLEALQRRNALELALLARRSPVSRAAQEALREAWELIPRNPEAEARRIRVALKAGELDADASLGKMKRKERARRESAMSRGMAVDAASSGDPFGGGFAAGGRAVPAPMASAPSSEMKPSFAMEEMEMEVVEESISDFTLMDDLDTGALVGTPVMLYRALPATKEWAEQNYYQIRAKADVASRVKVNGFWLDVSKGVPVSASVLEAHRTLTDVVTALAFCELPFEAEAPEEELEGASLSLRSPSPALLVSEQILPAEVSKDDRPLLMSQQFFRPDDPYRFEGNEQVEKFVTGEFIKRTVYGARVTLTNPTASRRRLNLLMQLPLGSIPVRNGSYTEDVELELGNYTTQTVEVFFTFPESGTFSQFPAHASEKEQIVGQAEARVFEVKDAPTEVDKTSWAWISQHASHEEVLAYLKAHNLRRINLEETAWRLKEIGFFREITGLLISRGHFHNTTFSYSLYHETPSEARVWLANSAYARQVGPAFVSPLLTVDPLINRKYEHLEYSPLVNPRAHEVGQDRVILNTAQREQYTAFLEHQMYLKDLSPEARLALLYHLQLQDRLPELKEQLALVKPDSHDQQMQTAYLEAWLALRELRVKDARALAKRYVDVPVLRWQKRFRDVVALLDGVDPITGEGPNRQDDMDRQASLQPSLELEAVGGELIMTAYNLKEVTLSLFPMDIELLFSRTPFLADGGGEFAVIRPAATLTLKTEGKGDRETLTLPDAYAKANVMVQISGKGQQASVARLANALQVRKMEAYGQVEVRSEADGNMLPRTYIKVFARDLSGKVSFWKDGYTDLRGRFDYLSLNNRKPEEAQELSILVLHPEHGAEILQATPPLR